MLFSCLGTYSLSLLSLDGYKIIGQPTLLIPDVLGIGSQALDLLFCLLLTADLTDLTDFLHLLSLIGVTFDFCLAFSAVAWSISVFDFL